MLSIIGRQEKTMTLSVAEALENVALERGRTYRCQIKDHWIELRVLDRIAEGPASALAESDIIFEPWTELPAPSGGTLTPSRLAQPEPPDVPEIPSDWKEP
jgi:hypothetical protein